MAEILIRSDFPGANIVVEKIEADKVTLRPDLRDTTTPWFFWRFKATGPVGKETFFSFEGMGCLSSLGPAVRKSGTPWTWLGGQSVQGNGFRFSFTDSDEVEFCVCIPYLENEWRSFIEPHQNKSSVHFENLCLSQKGRPIEKILIQTNVTKPHLRALVTARHHACESAASYALEGLLQKAIAKSAGGDALIEWHVVPFMDKDGVEDGDQGKNRGPHDHNRDYLGDSIYPSVKALKEYAKTAGPFHIALDLHCPCLIGEWDERVYFVGSSKESVATEQVRFCKILEGAVKNGIPFETKDFLSFGQAWNNSDDLTRKTFGGWASSLPEMKLVLTLEVPYALARGVEVTPESARKFGEYLFEGLESYAKSCLARNSGRNS
ncbi:MAG: hypothetical protein JNM63_12880 [Spirochaetia bacterium]|nr:hypothetical protein [Spirochaetia bacterium]